MRPFRGSRTRRRATQSIISSTTIIGLLSCISTVCAQLSSADYFVHDLPGAPPGPLLKMHAGHIEITPEHHGNLFFWHYQNRHIGDRQRTVVWLNGGPGCSSMDGALMEIGPYRVKEGGTLAYNPGSWDEFANLLFVDNPVGTGFSFVDTDSYLHELKEMADNFIMFLEKWFDMFPEYEHDDLYLAGESYAGQHIPYIARAILDRNADPSKRPWSLKGLLIGNGWTSPRDQYPSYLQYAYKRGLIKQGSDIAKDIEAQQAVCMSMLAQSKTDHVDIPECEAILQRILQRTVDTSAAADQRCINMYDVRLRDSYASCGMNWPPDLQEVTPYLRRQDVLTALHVSPDKRTGWSECSGAVSGAFRARNSPPAIELLPDILKTVPTVLFSGAEDLICNHIGTEEMIHNMVWNGGKGFELEEGTWAPRQDWTFEDEPAGLYQEARNLTYVLFYNASHMVPFDYPRRTRDMLDRFMGVDIGSIGGKPTNSRLDGEKGLETSVGGHPNSTVAEEEEASKLQQATYNAYYRSGEVALVFVIIAAGLWFYYIYRERAARAGYTGVGGKRRGSVGLMMDGVRDVVSGGARLESFRHKGTWGGGNSNSHGRRDLEAADFDEAELDRIDAKGRVRRERGLARERENEREREERGRREAERAQREREADMERERYSLGSDSDDEGADVGLANGSGRAR